MTSKIEKKEKSLVDLHLEFTAEEFLKALQEVYKYNAKRFSVPGFRKGKVPFALAMRYYGEGTLYDDAIDNLVNAEYGKLLDENNLEPVVRPELEIVKVGSQEGLTVILHVTNKPEVVLGEYKGIEAKKPVTEVKPEDVEAELKKVHEHSGRMVPVTDRPAAKGDTAKIDFKGYLDGKEFEGGSSEGHDLKLGSGTFIPGFEDQVIGHNIDDEFDVNVTFPEDYTAKELAGKPVVFKCKLHGLMVKELPELDDEFAKDVSEYDTLEEYKNSLRDKLSERAAEKDRVDFEDNVVNAVVANATVDIPDAMVESEIDGTVQRQTQSMRHQGIELNQYLQYIGKTLEEYRNEMREPAKKQIKTSLVIEAVTKKENLPISEDDYKAGIERIGKQYGMSPEELEKRFGKNNSMINDMIRTNLTVEMLVKEAKPVEEKRP